MTHLLLSDAQKQIVEEEISLHQRVQRQLIIDSEKTVRGSTVYERFVSIREQAAEAHPDDLAALVRELRSLQIHAGAHQQSLKKRPNPAAPYFAHMCTENEGKSRHLFIGYQTFIQDDIRILDWQTAPMARVFFNHEEGEYFEWEIGSRKLLGTISARRVVSFEQGKLTQIVTPDAILRRNEQDQWQAQGTTDGITEQIWRDPSIPLPFGTGATWHKAPPISALLDAAQFSAVQGQEGEALLLLGGAGCGKTTVALHRLVRLLSQSNAFELSSHMAVVVPEGGLARLIEVLLKELGTVDVPVYTYDQWILQQAQLLMPDLAPRLNREAGAAIITFKRHSALQYTLKAWHKAYEQGVAEELEQISGLSGAILKLLKQGVHCNTLEFLETIRTQFSDQVSVTRQDRFQQALSMAFVDLETPENSVESLFGEGQLLELAQKEAGAGLSNTMKEKVLNRSRQQLQLTAEQEFYEVEKERLSTADGLAIDKHSAFDLAQSVDIEDLPALFEMQRLKLGELRTIHGRPQKHQHLVIDEAQELSVMEMSALGACLAPGATLTVSGDEAQQLDDTTNFSTWPRQMHAVGHSEARTIHLGTNYRCPKPIMLLGQKVLGSLAPKKPPIAKKDGEIVLFSQYNDEVERAIALIQTLEQLMKTEPKAHVAIIARNPHSARKVYDSIRHNLKVRLVEEGAFEFRPGLDITDVNQVKGLEFDYVIVPDASRYFYPETDVSRRSLHVAVTRAIHQLWVISVGLPSVLIN